MPHSSGGGSHGGGFHGSSGGRSGSSSPKTSRRYFPGANRFVYYSNSRPVYYYSDSFPPKTKSNIKLWTIGCLIIILIFNIFNGFSVYHNPQKLTTDYNTHAEVRDHADIMTDAEETKLNDILASFLDLTGISPVVITDYNESWENNYNDIENYAYDLYIQNFKDEKHWLIVYTVPLVPDGGDFVDWYWEGMQGDDTDSVLTSDVTDKFNKTLHDGFLRSNELTTAEAFDQAFSSTMETIMKPGFDSDAFEVLLFENLFFFAISAWIIYNKIKMNRIVGAVKCASAKEKPVEDTCEYCKGIYVHDLHTSCPHCGAPVKARTD
ncbi:MAG: TPM domain-containing protein [Lachnospiraceae bacterium]|nr:TPM domain-containing protein [Lachnospiraceae bacterium]